MEKGKTADEYIRESIEDPGAFIVKGYPNAMPPFKGRLTDAQIQGANRLPAPEGRLAAAWPPPARPPARPPDPLDHSARLLDEQPARPPRPTA